MSTTFIKDLKSLLNFNTTGNMVQKPVKGIVVRKEYKEEYTTPLTFRYHSQTRTSVPHMEFFPEEFNVYVTEYGNNTLTETFNNPTIFSQYKKGDIIPLILVQKLDEQKLELPGTFFRIFMSLIYRYF